MEYWLTCASPLGTLLLRGDGTALTGLDFLYEAAPGEDFSCPVLEQAAAELVEYFAGKRSNFTVPLNPHGTGFQQRVWAALCKVPYGTTCSYGQLAAAVGNHKAARAVGMANHRNPLPIFIPCHRVIGADGSLTGYGGGLAIKEFLLRLEQVQQPFCKGSAN